MNSHCFLQGSVRVFIRKGCDKEWQGVNRNSQLEVKLILILETMNPKRFVLSEIIFNPRERILLVTHLCGRSKRTVHGGLFLGIA